jgi:hypothetical protein
MEVITMENLMKIGFGRANITPDDLVHLTGYGNDNVRIAKEIRDPLYATCIAFTDTDGNTGMVFTTDALNTYGGIMTPMSTEDVPCQNLPDKGKPAVMAVLDDVVTELILS